MSISDFTFQIADFRSKAALRSHAGPFTSELVREPGRFGLGQLPKLRQPAAVVKSICGFCSTGCGLNIHLDDKGQAINATPDSDHPVNRGMACPKGWEALTPLAAADRATTPLHHGKEVDWDQALQIFCRRFEAIMDQHGPESCAFLSTGQIMMEEMAFLGALAKFGMGMVHGDGNTRQCMATAVAAYKETFGFDAPPYTYADFEASDVLVFIGANPCIAHPIMWQRVEKNPHDPEIIVIDPRKTETAMAATQHLAIKPKSDLLLFHCLANWIIREGKCDEEFIERSTAGRAELREFLREFAIEDHIAETGLSMAEFEKAARSIADGKRVSFWWTMGVNQSHQGVRTAQAIINLALLTGNIGRPGTGANSITGQCNAMGSRLFSNTTNLLGGHDFTKVEHREKIARVLQIPVERIPSKPSWAYDQIIEGIESRKIRGLWMIATNGAHSWINQRRFTELVRKLDFFVVQDMYASTETARLADLLLPAAGWGEKTGCFINSERRIGLSHKASKAPGQALADFSIFRLIAHYWGCGAMFGRWTSPEAVFEILQEVTRGQPCDITGIEGYEIIEKCGGVQWPCEHGSGGRRAEREEAGVDSGLELLDCGFRIPQERRLFEDGKFFTADGRARFVFEKPQPAPEAASDEFPLVLLTGRGSSAQWHTETRTGKSAILRKLHPGELLADIHPADCKRLGIRDGNKVRIISRRAEIIATARATANVQPGQVFLPMHDAAVNQLTAPVFDPISRQPSYKHCAVRVMQV